MEVCDGVVDIKMKGQFWEVQVVVNDECFIVV